MTAQTWWRRNLVPLIVIAVCVPALIWMTMGIVLADRANSAARIVEVPTGESIELGGYTWQLTESNDVTGEQLETDALPEGMVIIGALLKVEPIPGETPGEDACETKLTAPSSAPSSTEQRRTWTTLTSTYDYNYGVLDDSTTFCSPDGEAMQYESVFLVPQGTYEQATVDMTLIGPGTSSTIYRFELVPLDD